MFFIFLFKVSSYYCEVIFLKKNIEKNIRNFKNVHFIPSLFDIPLKKYYIIRNLLFYLELKI